MIKRYFTQAFRQLRQNPVLSSVSILGTALAIGLTSLFYMTESVSIAKVYPMQHNDLYLWYAYGNARYENGDNAGNGRLALPFAQALAKPGSLGIATVYAWSNGAQRVSLAGDTHPQKVMAHATDENYWRVFDFQLLEGSTYDSIDCASGVKKAVISHRLAQQLFGEASPIGEEIYYNYTPYRVCGVVRSPSPYTPEAYAELWYPYSPDAKLSNPNSGWGRICGNFIVLFRANSTRDMPALRKRILQNVKDYNASFSDERGLHAIPNEQPDTHYWHNQRHFSNLPPAKNAALELIVLLSLFMLLPAVNIASIHSARMRRRLSELGVRRAYGATRANLFGQMLGESLLQTLLGGLLGFAIAVLAAYLFRSTLVAGEMTAYFLSPNAEDLPLSALLSVDVLLMTLLACLILNLVAAGIPAVRVARHSIVSSLNSKR